MQDATVCIFSSHKTYFELGKKFVVEIGENFIFTEPMCDEGDLQPKKITKMTIKSARVSIFFLNSEVCFESNDELQKNRKNQKKYSFFGFFYGFFNFFMLFST